MPDFKALHEFAQRGIHAESELAVSNPSRLTDSLFHILAKQHK